MLPERVPLCSAPLVFYFTWWIIWDRMQFIIDVPIKVTSYFNHSLHVGILSHPSAHDRIRPFGLVAMEDARQQANDDIRAGHEASHIPSLLPRAHVGTVLHVPQ